MGEKLTGFISIFFVTLMYLAFGYGEIMGIYHSATKHNDLWMSITLPPWAWYRSVEFWWHDDFADVNWDERLKNDAATIMYLIQGSEDIKKYNEDMEEFSTKIKHYPYEKLNVLKNIAIEYEDYMLSCNEDLQRMFKQYYINGKTDYILSAKTDSLEEDLFAKTPYDLNRIRSQWEVGRKQLIDKIKENADYVNPEKTDSYFMDDRKIKKRMFAENYKRIFQEEYNFNN